MRNFSTRQCLTVWEKGSSTKAKKKSKNKINRIIKQKCKMINRKVFLPFCSTFCSCTKLFKFRRLFEFSVCLVSSAFFRFEYEFFLALQKIFNIIIKVRAKWTDKAVNTSEQSFYSKLGQLRAEVPLYLFVNRQISSW